MPALTKQKANHRTLGTCLRIFIPTSPLSVATLKGVVAFHRGQLRGPCKKPTIAAKTQQSWLHGLPPPSSKGEYANLQNRYANISLTGRALLSTSGTIRPNCAGKNISRSSP